MYVSPFEPDTTVRAAGRAERDGDEDGSTTPMRASPENDGDPREEEPLDEPGYGHGV